MPDPAGILERRRPDPSRPPRLGHGGPGEETVEQAGGRIVQPRLETESGQPMASGSLGYGDTEIVPWQIDAVMRARRPQRGGAGR